MVRVCHMTSGHRNNDNRIFEKECISLAQAGYEVYYVVQGETFIKHMVQICGLGHYPISRIARFFIAPKLVYDKAIEIDADIYHFHDPHLLFYGYLLKKRGKRVIFDSHENHALQLSEKEYLPIFLRGLVKRIYKHFESFVISRLDAVIVPCTFNGTDIFEGKAKRVVFLDNLPKLTRDITTSLSTQDEQNRTVCYVGGLTYNRGVSNIVKAAYNAGAKLILAGDFSDSTFRNELQKMPEFKNVDYRGLIPYKDVLNLYREARVGLCTILNVGQYNKGDNFATKIYEYMMMGIPVILSSSKHARRVLEKYRFGLCVEPDDILEISQAISFLLDNPKLAKEMGENGRKAVLEKFNWQVEEKKLLELYSILSGDLEDHDED